MTDPLEQFALSQLPEEARGVPETDPGDPALSPILIGGLRAIQREQLLTGEIPSYRRGHRGNLEYRRSPFVSTFVFDALGYFDPRCPWVDPATLYLVPSGYRRQFVQLVVRIRQRIHAFIAWQEEAEGRWRFFGQGSGIDPDADMTACAATVLLEGSSLDLPGHWQRHVRALLRFQAEGGRFFSYIHSDQRGYSWMDEQGRPIVGFDRVVNANVLRFLTLAGVAVDGLTSYLLAEVRNQDFQSGSPDYPNPLCFFYMLARAWRQAHLPDMAALSTHIIPPLLKRQKEDGDFGGPLSTALALATLLDLGHTDNAATRARDALLNQMLSSGQWGYEDFFVNGFGSPTWTSALALAVLARYQVRSA